MALHLRRCSRGRWRPPTPGGCWPRAERGADRGLGRRRLAVRRSRCWPPVDLAGRGALLAAARRRAARGALAAALAAPERVPLAADRAAGWRCLLAPELVYVRDEFDDCDLYRMNTVFKFGYQAWLLLAIAAACALPWAGRVAAAPAVDGLGGDRARCSLLLGLVVSRTRATTRASDGFSRRADARRAGLAARERPRRRRGDRLAARERARGRGPARGRRPRLLGLRPRADLDLHRPPGRDRLGRPRGAVGARPGRPRADDVRAPTRRPRTAEAARRCSPSTASLRGRRPDRAHRLRRRRDRQVGHASAAGSSTATARRSGTGCRQTARRT